MERVRSHLKILQVWAQTDKRAKNLRLFNGLKKKNKTCDEKMLGGKY